MKQEYTPVMGSMWEILLGGGLLLGGGFWMLLHLVQAPFPYIREGACGWLPMVPMLSFGITVCALGIAAAAPGLKQRGRVGRFAAAGILGAIGGMWILSHLTGAVAVVFPSCGGTENMIYSVGGGLLLIAASSIIFWWPRLIKEQSP